MKLCILKKQLDKTNPDGWMLHANSAAATQTKKSQDTTWSFVHINSCTSCFLFISCLNYLEEEVQVTKLKSATKMSRQYVSGAAVAQCGTETSLSVGLQLCLMKITYRHTSHHTVLSQTTNIHYNDDFKRFVPEVWRFSNRVHYGYLATKFVNGICWNDTSTRAANFQTKGNLISFLFTISGQGRKPASATLCNFNGLQMYRSFLLLVVLFMLFIHPFCHLPIIHFRIKMGTRTSSWIRARVTSIHSTVCFCMLGLTVFFNEPSGSLDYFFV